MRSVLFLFLLLSLAWGSADVKKTKEEQKKNRLILLQLLQAELQETRLPMIELFLDSFQPLKPGDGGETPPTDELPDASVVDGGEEIQNTGTPLLPGASSGQQTTSLPQQPFPGLEDTLDDSSTTGDLPGPVSGGLAANSGFGYWEQSRFDFIGHYGKPLVFLLEETGLAHAHLGDLIQSPESTRYTYYSDTVVGEVQSVYGMAAPIAWGESLLGFDFGSGKAGFSSDSYLQIIEQDGSLWRVEGFSGEVGTDSFQTEWMHSTGEVQVGGGVLEGNFLGVSAEHVAGDFILKAEDKSASGNFFGTR